MKILVCILLLLEVCDVSTKDVIRSVIDNTSGNQMTSLVIEPLFTSSQPSINTIHITTTTTSSNGDTTTTMPTVNTRRPMTMSPADHRPCSISDSILFTREDAPVGTVLLQIPTLHGETWRLQDGGTSGQYLVMEKTTDQVRVVFKRTPDIEVINDNLDSGSPRETISFVLNCFYRGWTYKFRQELIIQDVNEHAPVFDAARSYNISISETSPVGTVIFSLRNLAWDPDITGRVAGYVIRPYLSDALRDGRRTFRISDNGDKIILFQPLDYDEMVTKGPTEFFLNITALDNGLPSPLTSYVILCIEITDADDQDPTFWYLDCPMVGVHCATPYFQAITRCGYKGPLHLYPGPIVAYDPDSINNTIAYSIHEVDPEKYKRQFDIDSQTGEVRLLANSCSSSIRKIMLTIKATEDSLFHRSVSTTLQVDILDNMVFSNRGWSIPTIHGSLLDGSLGENIIDTNKISDEKSRSDYTSLPVVFFVLSIFGFVAIGGGLAFAIIQITKKRKRKNIESSRKSSADSYISDCGGKGDKSDSGSVVTSFATSSSGTPAGHFINRCFEGIGASDSENNSTSKPEHGAQGQDHNRSSSNIEPCHGHSQDVKDKNENQIQNSTDEPKPSVLQNKFLPQWQSHHQLGQKSTQQDSNSTQQQQQQMSPFPFSSDLFIQRRNLFQQQDGRQQHGQYPPPPPPPLPLPRPKDQTIDDFTQHSSNMDTFSQQHHPQQQQQHQQQHHHSNSFSQNFDDPWCVLEDPDDNVEFNLHRATPGQMDTTSFLRGSNDSSSDSMKHDRNSHRVNLKKSCTFKEQLNKMVPECLNVNNLGYMSGSTNSSAAHSTSSSSGNFESSTLFRAPSGNSTQKVRFNMS